ncbi:hypothetical protein P7K49_005800 [Saguinus oedipus]|uniref:Ras-associating domain-containing protein n=1 Tax=Saguinus oedipus TaxID=9490 RepID=A0ABQ9W0M6_SAGOE|nr:hypothetical protein P7K49_005800 [Saguinus oedipus]
MPHHLPGTWDSWSFPGLGKKMLKIFDGDDAVRRTQFRLITVPRLASAEEVLVRGAWEASEPPPPLRALHLAPLTWLSQPGTPHPPAPTSLTSTPQLGPPTWLPQPDVLQEAALRAYHIPEDPGHLELRQLPPSSQACDAWAGGKAGSAVISEEGRSPASGEAMSEAWVIRALPRAQEVLKIYPGWLKVGVAYVSVRVTPQSTARSVVLEVLPLLGRQRTVLAEEQPLLTRLQDIRQVSECGCRPPGNQQPSATASALQDEEAEVWCRRSVLPGPASSPLSLQMSVRQLSQTRFYVAESRIVAPHISLFVGGLPPGLAPEEYSSLLLEAVATKGVSSVAGHGLLAGGGVWRLWGCSTEAGSCLSLSH